MDINTLRIVITLLSCAAFLGIAWWAFSGRQTARFDDAAQLPFADDAVHEQSVEAERAASAARTRENGDG